MNYLLLDIPLTMMILLHSLVASLSARTDEITLEEIYSLLLTSEARLSRHQLIFTDVWGPTFVPSTNGARYYVSFLDDYSKFLWLFPIKLKSDVEHIFLTFQKYVEKKFDRKIKVIQSDWGGEYHRLHTYFHQNGIKHRLACLYTHQQNGAIERKH